MRLIVWGLVIVGLGYVAYSGMMAGWSWLAVNNAVHEIVSREGVEAMPVGELKDRVMSAANEAGVPLADKDVTITRRDRDVNVEVVWTVPVVVVNGDPVVTVPLSVRRSSGR